MLILSTLLIHELFFHFPFPCPYHWIRERGNSLYTFTAPEQFLRIIIIERHSICSIFTIHIHTFRVLFSLDTSPKVEVRRIETEDRERSRERRRRRRFHFFHFVFSSQFVDFCTTKRSAYVYVTICDDSASPSETKTHRTILSGSCRCSLRIFRISAAQFKNAHKAKQCRSTCRSTFLDVSSSFLLRFFFGFVSPKSEAKEEIK